MTEQRNLPSLPAARSWFIDFLLIPAIVVLVGVAAFGLGRLSVLKDMKGNLVIHPVPGQAPPSDANSNATH